MAFGSLGYKVYEYQHGLSNRIGPIKFYTTTTTTTTNYQCVTYLYICKGTNNFNGTQSRFPKLIILFEKLMFLIMIGFDKKILRLLSMNKIKVI